MNQQRAAGSGFGCLLQIHWSGTNRSLEIGVLGDNKSARPHNEPLRQERASRTWLETKTDCPDKLWSLHPWRSQSTPNPKQTAQADPALSRGLGSASLRAPVQTQQFWASVIISKSFLMQFLILSQMPIHSWAVSSPNVYILPMFTCVALLL